ncbi:MAG: hypothetical protein F4W68_04700 [Cenarchaeum sp. SB0661_bin_35]|nr:hypothetical protein [Cenarchaeum sp. SB0667_bin_13]MXZ93007.1 hypothetical protein [Cenarchaeum sp. SB0666_bin_15]MYC79779.1 hypothetical protein [Cenarchaeum sp. SB0661_bin_35]MYD59257.1 hypothetical protein [Cenarchaeum sp. SB0678_bin_8]
MEIPEKLRLAKAEYQRNRAHNIEPTPELMSLVSEYNRWSRFGGEPPPARPRSRTLESQPYHAEQMELTRLGKSGVAPGDIPLNIVEGAAKFRGVPTPKYTKCGDSPKTGYNCKGRHGNGPRKNIGAAFCRQCRVAYMELPDDVFFCGCCGKKLSRRTRAGR